MTNIQKISKEISKELKSRLRKKLWRTFFLEETIIWLIIFPICYFAITTNIVFLGGLYIAIFLLRVLRDQLWINHDARVLLDHFSVELTGSSITYRLGNFKRTVELDKIEYNINKYGELTIKAKNRGIIDILIGRGKLQIAPETHNFRGIIKRIEEIQKTGTTKY